MSFSNQCTAASAARAAGRHPAAAGAWPPPTTARPFIPPSEISRCSEYPILSNNSQPNSTSVGCNRVCPSVAAAFSNLSANAAAAVASALANAAVTCEGGGPFLPSSGTGFQVNTSSNTAAAAAAPPAVRTSQAQVKEDTAAPAGGGQQSSSRKCEISSAPVKVEQSHPRQPPSAVGFPIEMSSLATGSSASDAAARSALSRSSQISTSIVGRPVPAAAATGAAAAHLSAAVPLAVAPAGVHVSTAGSTLPAAARAAGSSRAKGAAVAASATAAVNALASAERLQGKSSGSNCVRAATAVEPAHRTDELGRKVWDKAYYEAIAQSKDDEDDYLRYLPAPRQKKIAPPVEHRKPLQRRDFHIDLTRELGRSKIVTLQTPRMQQGGFWCDICECLIKDSAAYLDHINGRNHNRMLGMTMRVERARPEQVISKLREMERQAQLELEGEDFSTDTAASVAATAGIASSAVAPTAYVANTAISGDSLSEFANLDGGGKSVHFEENYDDIDRIKRRLEEVQKREEERKLKRKLKKKKRTKGEVGDAGGSIAVDELNKEEAGGQVEIDEGSLLRAMGLPSAFVGS